MSKTDSDNQAIANDIFLNLNVPSHNIDMRVVLLALREDLLIRRLRFSNSYKLKATNVVVPSLKAPFDLWYENGKIYFKKFYGNKKYKLDCEFEDDKISEKVVDLICALILHLKLNKY